MYQYHIFQNLFFRPGKVEQTHATTNLSIISTTTHTAEVQKCNKKLLEILQSSARGFYHWHYPLLLGQGFITDTIRFSSVRFLSLTLSAPSRSGFYPWHYQQLLGQVWRTIQWRSLADTKGWQIRWNHTQFQSTCRVVDGWADKADLTLHTQWRKALRPL